MGEKSLAWLDREWSWELTLARLAASLRNPKPSNRKRAGIVFKGAI